MLCWAAVVGFGEGRLPLRLVALISTDDPGQARVVGAWVFLRMRVSARSTAAARHGWLDLHVGGARWLRVLRGVFAAAWVCGVVALRLHMPFLQCYLPPLPLKHTHTGLIFGRPGPLVHSSLTSAHTDQLYTYLWTLCSTGAHCAATMTLVQSCCLLPTASHNAPAAALRERGLARSVADAACPELVLAGLLRAVHAARCACCALNSHGCPACFPRSVMQS